MDVTKHQAQLLVLLVSDVVPVNLLLVLLFLVLIAEQVNIKNYLLLLATSAPFVLPVRNLQQRLQFVMIVQMVLINTEAI